MSGVFAARKEGWGNSPFCKILEVNGGLMHLRRRFLLPRFQKQIGGL